MEKNKCKFSVGDRVELDLISDDMHARVLGLSGALGYTIGAKLPFERCTNREIDLLEGDQGVVDNVSLALGHLLIPAIKFDKCDILGLYLNPDLLKLVHATDSQMTFKFMGD